MGLRVIIAAEIRDTRPLIHLLRVSVTGALLAAFPGPNVADGLSSGRVIGSSCSECRRPARQLPSGAQLSEGGDEDGLDGVQAVLGLVEDDAGR